MRENVGEPSLRISTKRFADPTQIPKCAAAFARLIILPSDDAGSYSGKPRRSRISRTRTAAQFSGR